MLKTAIGCPARLTDGGASSASSGAGAPPAVAIRRATLPPLPLLVPACLRRLAGDTLTAGPASAQHMISALYVQQSVMIAVARLHASTAAGRRLGHELQAPLHLLWHCTWQAEELAVSRVCRQQPFRGNSASAQAETGGPRCQGHLRERKAMCLLHPAS